MMAAPDISPAALKSPVEVVAAAMLRSDAGLPPIATPLFGKRSAADADRFGSAAGHGPLSLKTWPRQDVSLYLYSGLAFSSSLVMLTMTFSP